MWISLRLWISLLRLGVRSYLWVRVSIPTFGFALVYPHLGFIVIIWLGFSSYIYVWRRHYNRSSLLEMCGLLSICVPHIWHNCLESKTCYFIHGSSQTWPLLLSKLQISLNLSCALLIDHLTLWMEGDGLRAEENGRWSRCTKFKIFPPSPRLSSALPPSPFVPNHKILVWARCFDLFGLKVIIQGSLSWGVQDPLQTCCPIFWSKMDTLRMLRKRVGSSILLFLFFFFLFSFFFVYG